MFIGLALDVEEVNHRVLAEEIPQLLAVNIGLALLRPAVRGDDQDFGRWLAALDELDPFPHEALLRPLARLPDHQIDRGRAEEQLVRGPVDALAAEVPAVEGDFGVAFGVGDFDWFDLDAVRGGVFLPGIAQQRVHQTGLADFAFADQDEFGFVERDLRGGLGAQVGFDGVEALFVGCGEFRVEGVIVEVEFLKFSS